MAIYRGLAESRPDAFLPDLAMALNNLGAMLSDLGQREEALTASEEAVAIYRRLAESRPDAFLPNLATSLGAMGSIHLKEKNYEAAVSAFAEGIRALREPFIALPQAFAQLMVSLIGDYEESVEAAGEEPDADLLTPIKEKLQPFLDQENQPQAKNSPGQRSVHAPKGDRTL